MANDKIEYDIIINGKKAKTSIEEVEKSQKKLTDNVKRSASIVSSGWFKIGATIATTTVIINKAIKASAEQLKVETQLATALKVNATAGQANLETWKEYASALQNTTTFGDEAILGQLAYLKTLSLTDEQMKKVTEASLDLSTATGMSLESSVMNLSKTLSGMSGELGEKIPQLRDLTTEELKAGKGIDVVSEAVRGQARAWAETGQGGLEQAGNSFGDVWEKAGDFFVLMAEKGGVIKSVNTLFEGMNNWLQNILWRYQEIEDLNTEGRLKKEKELTAELVELEKDLAHHLEEQNDSWISGYHASKAVSIQKDIDQTKEQIKALKELNETALDAGTVTVTTDGPKQTSEEIKELEKIAAEKKTIQERFSEEYKRSILSQSEYERYLIQKDYEEYEKAGVKKSELDAWRASELQKINDQEMEALDAYAGMQQQVLDGLANEITEFIMTGKADFADFARAIIAELIRIQVVKAIASAGSFLGFHTGTAEVKHSGGFIGMPSHHNGSIRTDERIAKLQVGEAVVNRAGASMNKDAINAMNAGAKIGSSGSVTTAEINFNVQAIDASSFNSYLVNNRQTIESIINKSLTTNGSVRQTIKQVV